MIDKFKILIDYEKNLMEHLVFFAEKQKEALVRYKISELELIASQIADISKKLRQAEEQRINLVMNWLRLSRRDASAMTLTSISEKLDPIDKDLILTYKNQMAELLSAFTSLNLVNRLLANKARNNVAEMLAFLTNGTNHVCNVKI